MTDVSDNESTTKERELLDWELSLHSSDLRAHPWYHGNISRSEAESLLQVEGEFLVRDSASSGRAGDFALSCVWKGCILHFLIQKVRIENPTRNVHLTFFIHWYDIPCCKSLTNYQEFCIQAKVSNS